MIIINGQIKLDLNLRPLTIWDRARVYAIKQDEVFRQLDLLISEAPLQKSTQLKLDLK